jgi:hypothetical protein
MPTCEEIMQGIVDRTMAEHVSTYHGAEPPDPPDPPDPPPPGTIEDTGLAGGKVLTGFWDKWLGRHAMGDRFESEGQGAYGTMANNTNGAVKMPGPGNPGTLRGSFAVDVYFDTRIPPGEGGGQHLIGLCSQTAKRAGPYDPDLDYDNLTGWLRLDFGVRSDHLRCVVYEGGHGTDEIGRIPFQAWRQWDQLSVSWEQDSQEVRFMVNGRAMSYRHHGDRNPIGNMIVVGNMDKNYGDRCRGDNDPCGLLGVVRYRSIRWENR